jgi:NitT/TauT family transport system permease protein
MTTLSKKRMGPSMQGREVPAPWEPPAATPARRIWRVPSGVSAILIGLLLWAGLAWLYPPTLLPGPGAVAGRLWDLAVRGVLWPHVATTLTEATLGFLLAAGLGLALGYFVAGSPRLEGWLAPYIAGTQAVPIVAIAPLMVLWFGLDLLPKVLTCAIIVFFPILVNTVIGLRAVDRDLITAAESFGAGRWQLLWYVQAPLALHTLLGGLRLGLTLSLTGAVVGEFIASNAGLGYLLTAGRTNYETTLVFAALATLAALAIAGYVAVGLLEHKLIDWQ